MSLPWKCEGEIEVGKTKVSPCFGTEKNWVGRDAIYRGRKHKIRRLLGRILDLIGFDLIGFELISLFS